MECAATTTHSSSVDAERRRVIRPASPQRPAGSDKEAAVRRNAQRLLEPNAVRFWAGAGGWDISDETPLLDQTLFVTDSDQALAQFVENDFVLDESLSLQQESQQEQQLIVEKSSASRPSRDLREEVLVAENDTRGSILKKRGRPKTAADEDAQYWREKYRKMEKKEKYWRKTVLEMREDKADEQHKRKIRLQMACALADSSIAVRAYSKDALLVEDAVCRSSLASYKAAVVEQIFQQNRAWIKSILDQIPADQPTFMRMGHDEFSAHFKKMGNVTAVNTDSHATQSRNSSAQIYLVSFWVPSRLREKVGMVAVSELRYLCELHILGRKNGPSVAASMVAMFQGMVDDLLSTIQRAASGGELADTRPVIVRCVVSDNLETNALAVRMARNRIKIAAHKCGCQYIVVYFECCPHKMNLVSSFAMMGNGAALAKMRGQMELWEGDAAANVDVGRVCSLLHKFVAPSHADVWKVTLRQALAALDLGALRQKLEPIQELYECINPEIMAAISAEDVADFTLLAERKIIKVDEHPGFTSLGLAVKDFSCTF
ncbi:unnamed protein product [Amoebophrya sp. A25]|nr:unnamed protein product [Amoebophrya sp. A25]|eukprot:GSA25T00021490001.1